MKLKKVLTLFKFNIENIITCIKTNYIMINNKVVNDPEKEIFYGDIITYNNIRCKYLKELNIVLYKPKGYLCANKDKNHKLVYDLLPEKYKYYKLSIAGRLDLDTDGLLVLTTSGKNNHLITNPINNIVKTYEVKTTYRITKEQLKVLDEEMLLLDGDNTPYLSKVIDYKLINDKTINISISTGKYHQVKRIFKTIRNPLIALKRIKLGRLILKDLTEGQTYEFNIKDL